MSYVLSLIVGVGVGALYTLLRVTPPAPPLIAPGGLLGMLAGENATKWAKSNLTLGRSMVPARADTEHDARNGRSAGT